ncbi:hypothetical protein Tco_0677573 [Tanacetum coccineum]|uniref:Uncharacterized protein n=1 Tax=Tanacetum coccineum TaxID=301880 RepID=A0ABQ4XCL0_9ASTR
MHTPRNCKVSSVAEYEGLFTYKRLKRRRWDRDIIQLETAVSTISSEYLLEFTSEYGIAEELHPELPSPGDRILDFPEGKVGVYTSDGTENQGQETVSPEVPPQENVPTKGVTPEISLEKEVAAMVPISTIGERSTRLDTGSTLSAPTLSETPADVSDPDPLSYAKPQSSKGATVAGDPDSEKSTSFTSFTGSPIGIYQPGWGVTNSFRLESPDVCQDVVDHIVPPGYFSKLCHLRNEDFLNQYNMNLVWQVAMGSQLRLRFEQEVRLLKRATKKVAKRDQRIQAREEEIKKLDQDIHSLKSAITEVQGLRNQTKNLEALLEAEVDMKKVAEAKNVELAEELESLYAKFSDL